MSESLETIKNSVANVPQNLEEGELSDANELDQFSDGYAEDLMGDADDRAKLGSMTELKREYELFQRYVRREELRRKWKIKRALAKTKDNESDNDAGTAKERSRKRRLNLEAMRAADKWGDAMERLVARRNEKKNRQYDESAQDQPWEDTEPTMDDISPTVRKAKKELNRPKKVKLKTADIYSDDSSCEMEPETFKASSDGPPLSTLAELNKSLLTRQQLANFVDKPIFEETVLDCFVRISLSVGGSGQGPIYRICQIVGIEQTGQDYALNQKRTKYMLRLQHGAKERSFRLDIVSNGAATNEEFNTWLLACQCDGKALPGRAAIERKEQDIEKANNYEFTEGDVEQMVQSKRRAGQPNCNLAYRKVCLIMERDMARTQNDAERVRQLDEQIEAINSQQKRTFLPLGPASKLLKAERLAHSTEKPMRRVAQPKILDEYLPQFSRANKSKVSLNMSRRRLEKPPIEPATESVSPEASNERSEPKTNSDSDEETFVLQTNANNAEINLYDLHNFEVAVDIRGLPNMNVLFKENKHGNSF